MITIEQTDDEEIIRQIINDPVLLRQRGLTPIAPNTSLPAHIIWLLAKLDGLPCGLLEIIPFTTTTVFGHIHLLSAFQRTGKALELIAAGKKLLKERGVLNVTSPVPVECERVRALLHKAGFELVGIIPQGTEHTNKIQDLLLYNLGVN